MDLNVLREELHKLSALVDGWSSREEIPALERDLALEKLRTLYDAVRFAAEGVVVAPVERAAEPVVPVSLDLGDILSFEPLPVEAMVVEPEPELEPESAPQSATPFGEEPFEADPFGETPVPGSVVVPAACSESPELPEADPVPASIAEPAAEPVVEPAAEPLAEPAAAHPEPVLGTLFGLDETVGHRRRQRVIMELYGNSHPEPQLARELKNEAPEERAVAEVPAVEEITIQEIAVEVSVPVPPEREPVQPADDPEEEFEIEQIDIAPGAVLGEVMNHDVQTLADTIAAPHDMASEIRRNEPVGDLRTAVGINDRFLLIRDLFEGDREAYEEAVATFNSFDNLDDCMIHIAENYIWNPNSDGAKLLMELLERKFA